MSNADRISRPASVICCAVLVALLPIAAGAMTITASLEPPSMEHVAMGFDTPSTAGYDWRRGVGAELAVGQTFHVDQAMTLDALTVKVVPETEIGGAAVTLWVGIFTDPFDASMNSLVLEETALLPAGMAVGEARYLTFDHRDLDLDPGMQYGFLLRFAGGGGLEARVVHMGADVYQDGRPIQRDGDFWDPLFDELAFFLHSDTVVEGDALLLDDGRFRVIAAWETPQGETGMGTPVALTEDSGVFWFFGPKNIELMVKVLDACDLASHHYWVFAAGMTNVGVTLTVTDTVAGETRTWTNPVGTSYLPVQETRAFETCDE